MTCLNTLGVGVASGFCLVAPKPSPPVSPPAAHLGSGLPDCAPCRACLTPSLPHLSHHLLLLWLVETSTPPSPVDWGLATRVCLVTRPAGPAPNHMPHLPTYLTTCRIPAIAVMSLPLTPPPADWGPATWVCLVARLAGPACQHHPCVWRHFSPRPHPPPGRTVWG